MEPIETIQIIKAEEVELRITQTKVKLMHIDRDYIWKMYKNPSMSDVTLIVEGKQLPVMRFVLSMHSSFFEELFNKNVEDQNKKEITLGEDIKLKPFETLLHFMYSGDLEFNPTEKKLNELVEILKLAHFLGVHIAVQKIIHYIFNNVQKVADIVELFNNSIALNFEILQKTSFFMIVINQREIFIKDVFTKFSEAALFVLLDSDQWIIEEYIIFQLVVDWLSVNTTTKQEELLQKIQLCRIDYDLLAKEIRQKNFFSDDHIFNAIETKSKSRFENSRKNLDVISIKNRTSLNYGYTLDIIVEWAVIIKVAIKGKTCITSVNISDGNTRYELPGSMTCEFFSNKMRISNNIRVTGLGVLETYSMPISVYGFLIPKFLQNEILKFSY